MKVIVSGGTGLVGTEVVRQALGLAEITSLVVLSRKPVAAPEDVDSSKLRQVIVGDYNEYSESARKEFAGAQGCIWTVAITPTKSKTYDFDYVRRICHDAPLSGFRAMLDASPAERFRFVYISGHGIERDQSKQSAPAFYAPYVQMRGETERDVIALAKNHSANADVLVAKPGLITSQVNMFRSIWGSALRTTNVFTNVSLEEVAASMLQQVVKGFTQETLENDDLKRLGREALVANSAK